MRLCYSIPLYKEARSREARYTQAGRESLNREYLKGPVKILYREATDTLRLAESAITQASLYKVAISASLRGPQQRGGGLCKLSAVH